jgi:hypothetical protein
LPGKIKIWDFRVKNPVATLKQPENQINDCWAVSFGNSHDDNHRFVCGGYENGDLRMFDLSMVSSSENSTLSKCFWETSLPKGICSIEFDRKDIEMNKMTATMLDSQFVVYDLRTKHSKKGFSKLVEKVYLKNSYCGRLTIAPCGVLVIFHKIVMFGRQQAEMVLSTCTNSKF